MAGYPRTADLQWIALGMPWVATAPFCAALPDDSKIRASMYPPCLSVLLATACLYVLGVHWVTWRRELASGRAKENVAWTERFGMAVAVAWPLQCGFALVTLSS